MIMFQFHSEYQWYIRGDRSAPVRISATSSYFHHLFLSSFRTEDTITSFEINLKVFWAREATKKKIVFNIYSLMKPIPDLKAPDLKGVLKGWQT